MVVAVVVVVWICNGAKSMLSCRFCSPNMSSWIVLLYKVYWHSAKCQLRCLKTICVQKFTHMEEKHFPTETPPFLDSEYGSSFASVMNVVKEKTGSERRWHPSPLPRICSFVGEESLCYSKAAISSRELLKHLVRDRINKCIKGKKNTERWSNLSKSC